MSNQLGTIINSFPGEKYVRPIVCTDGYQMSVQASYYHYCVPRPHSVIESTDGSRKFTAVEVGFPSERPEPWDQWRKYCDSPNEPTDTVYGFVPVELVQNLIELHGGEA